MKKTLLTGLLLASTLLLSMNAAGQRRQIKFEKLGIDHHLENALITCIFEDSKGFIWFGTFGGLYRFDGQEVVTYSYDPADPLSLGDNKITCMAEDSTGNLWVGAQRGLYYLDRERETFRRFLADPEKENSLSGNVILGLCVDQAGNIWIGSDQGLDRYDPEEEVFTSFKETPEDTTTIYGTYAQGFLEDKNGHVWILTEKGLNRYDASRQNFSRVVLSNLNEDISPRNQGWDLAIDAKGDFWIANQNGLIRYSPEKNIVKLFNSKTGYDQLDEGCNSVCIDRKGRIWTSGLSETGVIVFDPVALSVEKVSTDLNDPTTPKNNATSSIIEDRSGTIWVGTMSGPNKFDPKSETFLSYRSNYLSTLREVAALRSFYEIAPGQLLLWEETGLMVLDWRNNTIEPFPFRPKENLDDWNTGVFCFWEDDRERIWMGTAGGGVFRFDRKDRSFKHYKHIPGDSTSLRSNVIRDIYQDRTGTVWIANWYGGIHRFQEETETFVNYFYNDPDRKGLARNIYEDRTDTLWIGTRGGLLKYDRGRDTFYSYTHDPDDPASISENTAFDIYEDENGYLWIATYGGGLNRFDRETQTFKHYTTKDGLSDNTVVFVLPDDRGNLWLGTFFGISKFDLATDSITTYNNQDGTLNREYNSFSYYRSPYSGEMFFDGLYGLDIFHPDSLRPDPTPPPVVITDFQLFNRSVPVARDAAQADTSDTFFLSQTISETEEIVLPYDQKVITIKFAALHFASPEKNQYAYRLEGFDEGWQYVGNQRSATYTNLDPGAYTFRVKAANPDGIWNEAGASLRLIVTPPWWMTWWAYLLYALGILLLLAVFFRYQRQRWRLQSQLELEMREAERLKEMDAVKTQLYTNITHEFRTPLTVIAGMAEEIRQQPGKWAERGTAMIRRNSEQLLDLVNQLLELRKLESGNATLHWVQADLVPYLRYLYESFDSLATRRDIDLRWQCEAEEFVMDFDAEKLLRIVSNLLSNALKFTPEGGRVRLEVGKRKAEATIGSPIPTREVGGGTPSSVDKFPASDCLVLKVQDNGIGIPSDQLPFIFDRFYQVDDSATRQAEGTGIGLALTRQLVELLGGAIEVESEVGRGSTFTVALPIRNEATRQPTLEAVTAGIAPPFVAAAASSSEPMTAPAAAAGDKPSLLIVEDNPDVVAYLSACLEDRYQLLIARDGREGIELAVEHVPAIVISDVMMPEVDGFELCETLKHDERTSHIPIILLTARADAASRIQGLRRGADAYLAKPFHRAELEARLEQLVRPRERLRARYAGLTAPPPSEDPALQGEDEFLQKARAVVEARLDDADFSVHHLYRALGISRTQLHNKLKHLTGRSATNFIRTLRLHRARQLLTTTAMNVSEVTYEVGFNDPNYFSRCFQEEYGEAPSALIGRRG